MKKIKVDDWLFARSIKLFGTERLEKWKDSLAAYWELHAENLDEDKLLRVLTRMYGKREGKKLLRSGRSLYTKAILKSEEYRLIGRFAKKLGRIARSSADRFSTTGLKLEEHPYSTAIITHEGNTYKVDVDGLVCITGEVAAYHPDGTTTRMKIFSRWLSHPFWQFTHKVWKSETVHNG